MADHRYTRRAPWGPDMDARLTRLWCQTDPELPTSEIARLMWTTKNAIVKRARRMGLPSRPSPIKRSEPLRAVAVKVDRNPIITLEGVVYQPPVSMLRSCGGKCQFILSNVRHKQVFCDAPVQALGRSFCSEHAEVCYRRPDMGALHEFL